jgi:hypothetical protein
MARPLFIDKSLFEDSESGPKTEKNAPKKDHNRVL